MQALGRVRSAAIIGGAVKVDVGQVEHRVDGPLDGAPVIRRCVQLSDAFVGALAWRDVCIE